MNGPRPQASQALLPAVSLAILVAIVAAVRSRQADLGGADALEAVDALGRSFAPSPAGLAGTTFALGVLLLGAFLAGRLVRLIGLPQVSGYLVFGLLAGPEFAELAGLPIPALVSRDHLEYLRLVDALAISLIALQAGGEIRLRQLRSLLGRVAVVLGIDVPIVFGVVFAALLLAIPLVPFLAPLPQAAAAAVCMLVAVLAVANSPAIVIAIVKETAAVGPLAQTGLALTVLKDLVLIVIFTVALAASTLVVAGDGGEFAFAGLAGPMAWHLGGSLLVGALVGLAMQLLAARMGRRVDVFVIACGFLIAVLSEALHLAPLLVGLSAGFAKANLFPERSEPIFRSIENLAQPVYCVFFSVAGAGIALAALVELWPIALGIVAVRLAALVAGTWIACRTARIEPPVRTWLWTVLVPQAGVTIALTAEIGRTFRGEPWIAELTSLLLAIVTVHELIGPPLMRLGLARAGELGKPS